MSETPEAPSEPDWTETPETDLPMFTRDEAERLILMLGYGHGEAGFLREDWQALAYWAGTARMNEGILQNVLAGDLCVHIEDGEVLFGPTPKGAAAAEAIIAAAIAEWQS